MRNYSQPGNTFTVTAPADVLSGAGVKVGLFFGFALSDTLSGSAVEIQRQGVFEGVPKDASVFAIGDVVYWNNTAKNFTSTAGGNTKVGIAASAAATGVTTFNICLVPTI